MAEIFANIGFKVLDTTELFANICWKTLDMAGMFKNIVLKTVGSGSWQIFPQPGNPLPHRKSVPQDAPCPCPGFDLGLFTNQAFIPFK